MLKVAGFVLCALLLGVSTVSADTLATSPAGFTDPVTTTFSFPTFMQGPGPFTVGNGITVSGSPTMAVGGVPYGRGSNGLWTSTFYWAGTNNPASTMAFDLGGLFAEVGAFINYAPGGGTNPIITALGASMNVLESWDLALLAPIITPFATNDGAFRGISRTNADIRFLRFENEFIIAHSITTGRGAVPEPATLLLVGAGLLGFAIRARKLLRSPRDASSTPLCAPSGYVPEKHSQLTNGPETKGALNEVPHPAE